MPNWRKVIVSGSDAILNKLIVDTDISASLFSGSFIGDGSGLTGIGGDPFPYTGSAIISGSLQVVGSNNTIGNVVIQGSGSNIPLLLVTGSTGQLFSITDQNTTVDFPLIVSGSAGQLLSVNNIGDIYYGISSSILLSRQQTLNSTGSFITLYSIQTGSYTSAFVNYTIASGSNAKSGQLMSVWCDSTASWTEITTTHIGDASQIKFEIILSGSDALINVSASTTTDWLIKTSLNIL